MTPWQLARSVTARQFGELRAFHRIQPDGFEVQNWRAGVVCSTIAASVGARGRAPSDFYPPIPERVIEQSRDEMIAVFAAAAGGNVIVKKRAN